MNMPLWTIEAKSWPPERADILPDLGTQRETGIRVKDKGHTIRRESEGAAGKVV